MLSANVSSSAEETVTRGAVKSPRVWPFVSSAPQSTTEASANSTDPRRSRERPDRPEENGLLFFWLDADTSDSEEANDPSDDVVLAEWSTNGSDKDAVYRLVTA